MIYIDSNIFIYSATRQIDLSKHCIKFLDFASSDLNITTSCETTQEIIHTHRLVKKNSLGIKICKELLNLIPVPLEITLNIVKIYLGLAKKYPKTVDSRDLLHLAVCVENNINTIVTYDKHFKKFKEIKSFTPEEMLKK